MPQTPWSVRSVEARPVASLLPYTANARTHAPEQVAQIAASIVKFGLVAPILVDERGEIIAGHGRLEAAKSLGLDMVPVIVCSGPCCTDMSGIEQNQWVMASPKF